VIVGSRMLQASERFITCDDAVCGAICDENGSFEFNVTVRNNSRAADSCRDEALADILKDGCWFCFACRSDCLYTHAYGIL